jgi:hypothetical protein
MEQKIYLINTFIGRVIMTWDITAKFAHFIFFVSISVVSIANLLRDAQFVIVSLPTKILF